MWRLLRSENNKFLSEIVPLLNDLEVGGSNISLISSFDKKTVEIKIRENIKLSSKLITNLSLVDGIDSINFE